jgi:hypothetical protein
VTPLYFFSSNLERSDSDRIIAPIYEDGACGLHKLAEERHILE